MSAIPPATEAILYFSLSIVTSCNTQKIEGSGVLPDPPAAAQGDPGPGLGLPGWGRAGMVCCLDFLFLLLEVFAPVQHLPHGPAPDHVDVLVQGIGEGEEDVFVLYPEGSFFRASGETPRRVSSSFTSLALMPGLRRARSASVNSGSSTISLTRLLM